MEGFRTILPIWNIYSYRAAGRVAPPLGAPFVTGMGRRIGVRSVSLVFAQFASVLLKGQTTDFCRVYVLYSK